MKIPVGSFSRGVFKVSNAAELQQVTRKLLKESDLILAQEFLYTEFDWRVGILGGEPLFVCQYYMSKQHWQIVNHAVHGRPQMGMAKTFAVSEAPRKVVKIALKAANLIGDGLYGVDIKEHPRGLFVIEVNDNPNIDAGVEDLVLKDQLYLRVIDELARRLDRLRAH